MLITHISNNILHKWWINTAKHYGSCHRIAHMDHGPGTEILQFYENIETAKKNIANSKHFLIAWDKNQDDFLCYLFAYQKILTCYDIDFFLQKSN